MLQGVGRFFKKQSAEEPAATKSKQHADCIAEHGAQDTRSIAERDAERQQKHQCLLAMWRLSMP